MAIWIHYHIGYGNICAVLDLVTKERTPFLMQRIVLHV